MNKFAAFIKARVRVLEHIVEGGNVSNTLDILCRDTEDIDPAMRCSVLYFDREANCLRHAAAPSLPDFYNNAIDGLQVGLGAGSCGTAAHTGERVIVEDVYSHPYWEQFRDLAKEVGFHACWSQPIYSKSKEVLGTFAMYYDEVRQPTEEDLQLIQAQANLASLAIERKRNEEALRESEARFRDFAEASSDWYWEMGPDLRFTSYSPRVEEAIGVSPDWLIGKTREEQGRPEVDDEKWVHHLDSLKAHEPFKGFEYDLKRGDGTRVYVRTSGMPVFGDDGDFLGYRGTGTNVTEQKLTEKALTESEARLHDAVNSLHEGFVLFDKDDRLVLCNGVYRAFYPTIADDMVPGVRFEDLLRLSIERGQFDLQGLTENEWIAQRLEKHQKCEGMFGHSLPDGRHILYSERRTKDGGIVGTRLDITERVQIEEQTRTIEEQLRRSQKMDAVGQLTGGIAHDFNNILGIVMGNLEILQQMVAGNDEALGRVKNALKGAERGADLTRKLLGFSRKGKSKAKSLSVNDHIQSMDDLLAKSLTVAIDISFHFADDLWSVEVNPGDLEDCILNLTLNARDAMPEGGALVIETANKVLDEEYVRLNPQSEAGEYVMMSISDTGHGMTTEVQEKALEPFYTTKKEGQGTGLGLSMVYGFVQRSGGHVDIYSEPENGTTIRIYLPRGQDEGTVEVKDSAQIVLLTGSESILVVDDEEHLVDIAVSHLEELGYKTLTANNGKQALKILKDNKDIDLLFSDIIMPDDLDGYQLAIAAQKVRPSLKTLLTSGFTKKKEEYFSPDGSKYAELASKLLSKPYSHTELALAVRRALNGDG